MIRWLAARTWCRWFDHDPFYFTVAGGHGWRCQLCGHVETYLTNVPMEEAA